MSLLLYLKICFVSVTVDLKSVPIKIKKTFRLSFDITEQEKVLSFKLQTLISNHKLDKGSKLRQKKIELKKILPYNWSNYWIVFFHSCSRFLQEDYLFPLLKCYLHYSQKHSLRWNQLRFWFVESHVSQ